MFPILGSYQSENIDVLKEKENKGFFSFFQRNKKKREQVRCNFVSGKLLETFRLSNQYCWLLKIHATWVSFYLPHLKAASAPATPLMSKPRPVFITRSNTVSKQYDSNTLPAEMPKKRRAPLPPMPTSQSAPQELARAPVTPASGMVKSNSFERNEQVSYICFTSLESTDIVTLKTLLLIYGQAWHE